MRRLPSEMELPSEILHGVYPVDASDAYHRVETPCAKQGLLLDLRGCDYSLGGGGTWINRATIGRSKHAKKDATVPSTVKFDDAEKAFVFTTGGDVITVPLATNPYVLKETTYAVWVKARTGCANLAWIMCQNPDYGWSRALTLNDYRLGHISVTTSQYWDSKLGQAPIGVWIHVAGVWHSDGTATVYLNGVRGATTVTNNGKRAHCSEEQLIIGGRSPHDPAHNSAMLVSDVCVFRRALDDEEMQLLYSRGRTLEALEHGSLVLTERSLNTLGCIEQTASAAKCASPSSALVNMEPIYDEATGLFWCNTGIDPHDLPDGGKWQEEFRTAVKAAKPKVLQPRVLVRTGSDTPAPGGDSRALVRNGSDGPQPGAGRRLALHPSDPDKRVDRASHTQALRQMDRHAGVELRLLGRNIALFRFDGRVFAVDAMCPHQGASLCEGEIGDIEDLVEGQRFYVRCKVHKFQFDLTSGAVIDGTCPPLRIYNARVRERRASTAGAVEVGFETLPADYFANDDEDF